MLETKIVELISRQTLDDGAVVSYGLDGDGRQVMEIAPAADGRKEG